jgi:hypothetical protein
LRLITLEPGLYTATGSFYLHRLGAWPFALPHPKHLRRFQDSPRSFWCVIPTLEHPSSEAPGPTGVRLCRLSRQRAHHNDGGLGSSDAASCIDCLSEPQGWRLRACTPRGSTRNRVLRELAEADRSLSGKSRYISISTVRMPRRQDAILR